MAGKRCSKISRKRNPVTPGSMVGISKTGTPQSLLQIFHDLDGAVHAEHGRQADDLGRADMRTNGGNELFATIGDIQCPRHMFGVTIRLWPPGNRYAPDAAPASGRPDSRRFAVRCNLSGRQSPPAGTRSVPPAPPARDAWCAARHRWVSACRPGLEPSCFFAEVQNAGNRLLLKKPERYPETRESRQYRGAHRDAAVRPGRVG